MQDDYKTVVVTNGKTHSLSSQDINCIHKKTGTTFPSDKFTKGASLVFQNSANTLGDMSLHLVKNSRASVSYGEPQAANAIFN